MINKVTNTTPSPVRAGSQKEASPVNGNLKAIKEFIFMVILYIQYYYNVLFESMSDNTVFTKEALIAPSHNFGSKDDIDYYKTLSFKTLWLMDPFGGNGVCHGASLQFIHQYFQTLDVAQTAKNFSKGARALAVVNQYNYEQMFSLEKRRNEVLTARKALETVDSYSFACNHLVFTHAKINFSPDEILTKIIDADEGAYLLTIPTSQFQTSHDIVLIKKKNETALFDPVFGTIVFKNDQISDKLRKVFKIHGTTKFTARCHLMQMVPLSRAEANAKKNEARQRYCA